MGEWDDHNQETERNNIVDLKQIMQDFGISEWRNLGPVESFHEGLSLLLEVDSIKYILREQSENVVGSDLTHFYRFQHYLEREGLPVVPFWLTPRGESFVNVGEDRFELQRLIEGDAFSTSSMFNLDWVAASGAMLARLHKKSLNYSGPRHIWPAEVHVGALTQGWLNFARMKANEIPLKAVSVAIDTWVDGWERVLPRAMMSIGSAKGIPEFHIHGDYQPRNLIFESHGIRGVQGFHASRWERRLIELAYALFYFSALEWKPGDSLTRPLVVKGFDPTRARRFLSAYGAIYPATSIESSRLVDALTLIAPILIVNGPLEDAFYDSEFLDEESHIQDVLERFVWASSFPSWLDRIRNTLSEMWQD